LDRHIEEANSYLQAQKQAFVALESYKINSHVDVVNDYSNEIIKEQSMQSKNKELFKKVNILENDVQQEIVSWKNKYADINKNNEYEIAELHKKYENIISDNNSAVFIKEENYKKTIGEQDSEIWKLRQEGDIYQKHI